MLKSWVVSAATESAIRYWSSSILLIEKLIQSIITALRWDCLPMMNLVSKLGTDFIIFLFDSNFFRFQFMLILIKIQRFRS